MSINKNVWFFPEGTTRQRIDYKDRDSIVRYLIDNMFIKSLQMFEYKGLPDTIPQKVLEYQLQMNGFSTIFEHDGELYACYGGLGGVLNYNYLPTISIVANPYLRITKTFKIGKDCVVGKNDFLYIGLNPTHSLYAENMTDNLITARVQRINMRAEYVFAAGDDDEYKSIQEFYDGLYKGELKAVQSSAFFKQLETLPLANSASGRAITQLIEDMQYNKASWWNELGVMANYNMKRESINSNESQLNESALLPFSDHMLEMRKNMCDEVNKMFGTNWSVDFSSTWKNLRRENKAALEKIENEAEQSTNMDNNKFEEQSTNVDDENSEEKDENE